MSNVPGIKRQQKLSRTERMKRNPFAWIILLVLSMIFLGTVIFPQFSEWESKKSEIALLETQVQKFKQENEIQRKQAEEKELEFNLVATPFLTEEKQIFPTTIDVDRIIKILEVYTLQLENLDTKQHDSRFSLEKVSFSGTKATKNLPYSETGFNISFQSDDENYREFIHFLQKGKLSERFQVGKDRGQIQLVDYKFLEDNLLPLVQLDSIKASNDKDGADFLNVQIKGRFFSQ